MTDHKKLRIDSELIGNEAYARNQELIEIELLNTKEIAWAGFAKSRLLKRISLPDSLVHIGDYAFLGCVALEEILIPQHVKTMGHGVFSGLSCKIKVDERNPYFCSIDGVLYSKDLKKLLACPNRFEYFEVPSHVEEIGWSAFRDCSKLKELIISENVLSLGEDACYNCTALERVVLPKSIKDLGWLAFSQCSSLKEITLPEGLTKIGWSLFSACHKLETIKLPASVEEIGLASFAHCYALTEIDLPKGLRTIGGGAFSDCPNLKRINCYSPIPPKLEDFDFYGELQVPEEAVELYKQTEPWSQCKIIKPLD